MSQNVSTLELLKRPIASVRAELASSSLKVSPRASGTISLLSEKTTLNAAEIMRVLGVREQQASLYPLLADAKLIERPACPPDEWAKIEDILGILPLPLPPLPTQRHTLISSERRPRGRPPSQPRLPGVVQSLAESRPGPDRQEMDWLATQLQATAEDRASGAVEEFDEARFEKSFLPWVIEKDRGLRDRFITLVYEYMEPAPGTKRLYGYPFPESRLPDMAMPQALAATLPERRAWLAAAQARAAVKENAANIGRVSMTRLPLSTIGPEDSVDGILVLDGTTDALRQWQPMFVSRVIPAAEADDILSDGEDNSKLGSYMTVGPLVGFRIRTINLAERATCDIGCPVGDICFGNGMHMANRILPDDTYFDKFRESVRAHRRTGRKSKGALKPVLIRAHTLGDYYDPEYVDVCDEMIAEAPGHTAFWVITARLHSRHPMAYLDFRGKKTVGMFEHSTAIGDRLMEWQLARPYNVQLWFSSQLPLPGSFTTLFENPFHILSPEQQKPRFMRMTHGIICPAEIKDPAKAARIAAIHEQQRAANPNIIEATLQGATGRVDTCGDCGYCEAPMPGNRGAVYVTAHGPSPGRKAGS